jgi:CelD/BcsL family acetyltransferase involved in cellulose biosynthesis
MTTRWQLLPAARFADAAPRWAALHAAGPAAPMLAAAFVGALLADFGGGDELVALCERNGRTCAAAVLAKTGPGRWATFQPAQAPLGLWLQDPELDTGELLDGLARILPGFVLLIGLTQCDPLLLPRPADRGRGRTLDYIATAHIDVTGSFDAYWNTRGKNLRNNLKKQRKQLADGGIALRLEMLDQPNQMAAALADYGRLEGAGWKARGGSAVLADNAQGRFYERMLAAFAAHGQARVYRYWFGERLAAMDLCILERDCIVILKTAYDEAVAGSHSPALLMREEACRGLFGEGRFTRIEFYGRVMAWHTRWTEAVRTLYHFNHYRWPALARVHARRQATRNGASHVS